MSDFGLFSAFLIGIAGSVHCVGMCGGIVGTFTMMLPKQQSHWPFTIAYNSGRIFSYGVAGALTGLLGGIFTNQIENGLNILSFVSGLFLLLLGLYIGNWWRILTHLERLGGRLWKHISPLGKRFLPLRSPIQALPFGMVWGWLPCGLVYSTLTWSLASGSPLHGFLIMIAFGMGTLPALFALGSSAASVKNLIQQPWFRQLIAIILIIYALILLFQGVNNVLSQ